VALVIGVVIKSLIAQAFFIPSESMTPQLAVGDRVVVSKLAYRLHSPHRGDIVVFDAPVAVPKDRSSLPTRLVRDLLEALGASQPSTEEYIKRVVALPGERVEGHGGHVFVDGHEVVEPYLTAAVVTSAFPAVVVPQGKLWVMGDNRTNSSDSRVFGPIRESKVVGRAIMRVWPPGRTAFL